MSRNVERTLLVVILAALVWLAWSQRRLDQAVRVINSRLINLETRVDLAESSRAKAALASLPIASLLSSKPQTAPTASPTTPRPRRNKVSQAKARVPPVPGAQVLSRLYDAADEMAVSEDWDGATYEDVALVFEDTTAQMVTLWDDIEAGHTNSKEARTFALALRDDAQLRLAEILGADGFERLRLHIQEEPP